jgi:hypothetical protein
MPPSSGTSHAVNCLFVQTTSCTFSACCSCFDVYFRPERGESSIEFQPSLSVCTTHMFEFSLWNHYQTLSITFQISMKKVPLYKTKLDRNTPFLNVGHSETSDKSLYTPNTCFLWKDTARRLNEMD